MEGRTEQVAVFLGVDRLIIVDVGDLEQHAGDLGEPGAGQGLV
ncbi:hypothetical protein [Nonomuraea terrae]|nr:hypothetical protein [Nonomuraea terrae]